MFGFKSCFQIWLYTLQNRGLDVLWQNIVQLLG
jgi:hypothetical protein